MLELSGLPKADIRDRLSRADVIYVEGGNLYYLAHSIVRCQMETELLNFLQDKVYVGVSAGSMVFTRNLSQHIAEILGEAEDLKVLGDATVAPPFGLYDWYLKPHFRSSFFPDRDEAWLERAAKQVAFPIYAIDDQMALQVVDGNVTVVSEGTWKLANRTHA